MYQVHVVAVTRTGTGTGTVLKSSAATTVPCLIPRVLVAAVRRLFSSVPQDIHISVSRARVFEDSYHQLRHRDANELKGRISVHFVGEEVPLSQALPPRKKKKTNLSSLVLSSTAQSSLPGYRRGRSAARVVSDPLARDVQPELRAVHVRGHLADLPAEPLLRHQPGPPVLLPLRGPHRGQGTWGAL
jgi:hypothetical protein